MFRTRWTTGFRHSVGSSAVASVAGAARSNGMQGFCPVFPAWYHAEFNIVSVSVGVAWFPLVLVIWSGLLNFGPVVGVAPSPKKFAHV